MLNISKYQKVLVGCSAIVAVSLTGYAQSANAQANQSNGSGSNNSGSNVTGTINSNSSGTSITGRSAFSAATISRASALSSRLSLAQANVSEAAQNLAAAEAAQPVAADTTPVRYSVDKGVADLASCGCPNADTIGSAPTTTAPSPELLAARTAESDAAAELAAAQAEARQFIESVKSGATATSSTVVSQLW